MAIVTTHQNQILLQKKLLHLQDPNAPPPALSDDAFVTQSKLTNQLNQALNLHTETNPTRESKALAALSTCRISSTPISTHQALLPQPLQLCTTNPTPLLLFTLPLTTTMPTREA